MNDNNIQDSPNKLKRWGKNLKSGVKTAKGREKSIIFALKVG